MEGGCFHSSDCACIVGKGQGKTRLRLASRDQCCVGVGEHGRGERRRGAKAGTVGCFSSRFVTLGSGGGSGGLAIPGCVLRLETIPGHSLPKHLSLSLLLNQRENCPLEVGDEA